eukprot:748673-Hanusia_phi.AAC.3
MSGNPLGLAAGCDKHGEAVRRRFGSQRVRKGSPWKPCDQPRQEQNCGGENLKLRGKSEIRLQEAIPDYVYGVKKVAYSCQRESQLTVPSQFGELADFLVVNISSPNTPGLRRESHNWARRGERFADSFVATCRASVPLLVKIAPDLSDSELKEICQGPTVGQVATKMKVDGMVVTNTTVSRPETLKGAAKEGNLNMFCSSCLPPSLPALLITDGLKLRLAETGGLSGLPLKDMSTEGLRWSGPSPESEKLAVISKVYKLTGGKLPLIGVGGVGTGQVSDAHAEEGDVICETGCVRQDQSWRLAGGDVLAFSLRGTLVAAQDQAGAEQTAQGRVPAGVLLVKIEGMNRRMGSRTSPTPSGLMRRNEGERRREDKAGPRQEFETHLRLLSKNTSSNISLVKGFSASPC